MHTTARKLFSIFSLLASTIIAYAQPGITDSSFGINGLSTPEINEAGFGWSVALQSDGKILSGGGIFQNSQFRFAVVRLNPDGSVDYTFGINGVAAMPMDSQQSFSSAIDVQLDGKIVEAGCEGSGNYELPFVVARFNPDGSIDNNFGINGKVVTPVMHGVITTSIVGLVIQSDGKIIITSGVYTDAAYAHEDFALIRYNSDGSLDASFGNNGIVITDVYGNNYDAARAVKIQEDGKIIAGGLTIQDFYFYFAIVRYNTNGSIDSSFGTNGRVIATVDSFYDSDGCALALQPDGKIIIGGEVDGPYSYNYDFGLMRFNADGSVDNTFGVSGAVTSTIYAGYNAVVASVLLQSDGKIIETGNTGDTSGYRQLALARFNHDGSIDTGFGNSGKATAYFSDYTNGGWATMQQDCKIVIVGISSQPKSLTAARFLNDPFVCSTNSILNPEVLNSMAWSVFPNPASGNSFISYTLSTPATVSIALYDVLGNNLRQVVHSAQEQGEHGATIDTRSIANGVYVLQIRAGDQMAEQKIVVMN